MRFAFVMIVLAGCGARSGFGDLANATPASDASFDAAAASDAASDVAVPTRPCQLALGELRTIAAPPYDISAGGVLGRDDGALVTWTSNNDPSPDARWHVTQVDTSGEPKGDVILASHSGSYGSPTLAEGFGRRAAAVWDSRGSVFIRMAADGSPESTRSLGRSLVRGLGSYEDGFTLLEETSVGGANEVRLLHLDPAGSVRARTVLLGGGEDPFWYARAARDDGSFLLGWMSKGLTPTRVAVRSFGRDGLPRAGAIELARLSARAATVAVTRATGGFLVGWIDGDRDIRLVRTGDDGAPLEPVRPLEDARSPARNELVLARVAGAVVAAWIDDVETTRWELRVRQLTSFGLPNGPILRVEGVRFALGVRIVPTAEGALIVFTGSKETARNAVYAVPLKCAD